MDTDNVTIRLVIGTLGLTILLCVVGAIVLCARHIDAPQWLSILASSLATGLLGWLIPSPLNKKATP